MSNDCVRIRRKWMGLPTASRRALLDALDAVYDRLWAALSADADADADAEPCAHESWEENGGWAWCPDCRHGWPVGGLVGHWDSMRREPSRAGGFHHDYGCTHDPAPSRAGAMDCGHDSINYSYVLGHCRACDMEHVEPSRAEGDDSAEPRQPEAHEDGFVRAWQAMGQALDDAEGDEVPVTDLLRAAIASGGVIPREDYERLTEAQR